MAISDVIRNFGKHPRYSLMRAVARFDLVRKVVTGTRGRYCANATRQLLANCEKNIAKSYFKNLDLEKIVNDLRRDGVAFGLLLPEEVVESLRRFADEEPCYAFRQPDLGFRIDDRLRAEEKLKKPILLAQYFNAASRNELISRLSQDPALLWIAASYLGSQPTFVGANMWWTFPVRASDEDRNKHAHFFHRDVDDFRFFKFFFYLTDVRVGEGAHVCVATSHQADRTTNGLGMKQLRRFNDVEVRENYGEKNIIEISGKAGTGFAENTLCIHKGMTPVNEPRLLLQLQYAFFDYGVMHDERSHDSLQMIL